MDVYPLPARRLVAEMADAAAADPARALAYQGAPGANSHLAALTHDPLAIPLPCYTFEDAIDAVREGRAGRAIIPIENSLHGRVADMHFLLPESGLSIIDEYFQRIHHCLMATDADTPIATAASHVQALGQCRHYLRQHGIRPITDADTAGAAALVAEAREPGAAAIAPALAAELYGLVIRAENIEDSDDNMTRFVVLAREPARPTARGAGDDDLPVPGEERPRRPLQGDGGLRHQWGQHDQAGKLPARREFRGDGILLRHRGHARRPRRRPGAGGAGIPHQMDPHPRQLPAGAPALQGLRQPVRALGALARGLLALVVWALILVLLAATIVPPFLDRLYYAGPAGSHFDGAHFLNPDGDPIPEIKGTSNGVLARFLTQRDARPTWPDSVTVRPIDARRLPPLRPGEMRAIWIGHATVLVQTATLNILTDPIWSDVAGPFGLLGPRRLMAPGVPFDQLPRIDIVVVSHNHYDHLDLATLQRLWARDRPVIVTGLGNERLMAAYGIEAHGLDWGQMLKARGTTVHVTRSHHWSSRWFVDRDRALWSGFTIETAAGRIFFAGDTGPGDMRWPVEARRWGPIRLALIPIGAFRFAPHQMVAGAHIGPRAAVDVFRLTGAAAAIPIHWGTFHLSGDAWGTPIALLRRFEDCAGVAPARFPPLRPGVPFMVPATPAPLGIPRLPVASCRDDAPGMRAFP